MIPYCVEILRGRVPEQNERKITKPVALILLAHYVGDIHQPLHVGAEYFDVQGRIADPGKDKSSLGDEGGNTFTLELNDEPPRGRGIHKKILHAFWDYDAVKAFFPEVPKTLRKSELEAQIEPLKNNWLTRWLRTKTELADAATPEIMRRWADEILPIARRPRAVKFTDIAPQREEDRSLRLAA
jgi:hypothetical protein